MKSPSIPNLKKFILRLRKETTQMIVKLDQTPYNTQSPKLRLARANLANIECHCDMAIATLNKELSDDNEN